MNDIDKAKKELPKNVGLKDVKYFEDKIEHDRSKGFDTSKTELQLELVKEVVRKKMEKMKEDLKDLEI